MKVAQVPKSSSPIGQLTVLCLSPHDEDHDVLHMILKQHTRWKLHSARTLKSALALLQEHDIAVLVCERDLKPGSWKDVLESIVAFPVAPSLIVSCRLADERLWAEALNLGAWDVLAKPFNKTEVIRSVRSGWQHWYDLLHASQAMKAQG